MADLVRVQQQRRRRRIGLCCAAALLLVFAAAVAREWSSVSAAFTADSLSTALAEVWSGWRTVALNGWYWLFVAGALVLEHFFPGRDGDGVLTRGGAQDFVWVVISPLWSLTIVALYLALLNQVYAGVFNDFSFDVSARVGTVAAFVIAFLVGDFTMWFTHFIRHKVPSFWHFHAVHHSQRRMNTMTDWRVHFVESCVSATLVFIPAKLVGIGSSAAAVLAFLTVYFTGFTHTNLRTNLGPLRYLIVTPQSHRVHHSYAYEHWDKNFGAVLSIWDRIFRTQYHGADEYPPVGIPDEHFPSEASARPDKVFVNYWRQQWYPFSQLIGDVGKYRRLEAEALANQRSNPDPSGPAVSLAD